MKPIKEKTPDEMTDKELNDAILTGLAELIEQCQRNLKKRKK